MTNLVAPTNEQLFLDQMSIWSAGIGHEVSHWLQWIKTRGDRWPQSFINCTNPDSEIGNPVAPLVEQIEMGCSILDVGSGPLSTVGKKHKGRALTIAACDPLANVYNALLEMNGVIPLIKTAFADGEHLSAFYSPSSFDITYCNNAMDHSLLPLQGIEEMLRVTKVGGYAVLRHSRNEGEYENYGGLHQNNFDFDGQKFIVWNKVGRTDVGAYLPIKTEISIEPTEGRIFTAKIKKLEEFSDSGMTRHSRQLASLLEYLFNSAISQGMQQLAGRNAA